jgi:hypothetical protein
VPRFFEKGERQRRRVLTFVFSRNIRFLYSGVSRAIFGQREIVCVVFIPTQASVFEKGGRFMEEQACKVEV